jgi:dihydrodipicolinate synthase/N-acetylneuraminate lyase
VITHPAQLQPHTPWSETVWGHPTEDSLVDHHSESRFCVATLLPFADGTPDWAGFERSIQWMLTCGSHYGVDLTFVLNADTGYLFNLDLELYREVITRFRKSFHEPRIICGVTALGNTGETFDAACYRPQLDVAQDFDNVEVMIMTSSQLNRLDPEPRRDAYFTIAKDISVPAIVHALEPAFIPWATPFEPWLLHELAQHPKFVGGKISTLDEPHFLYWAAMCRDLDLPFTPHSGDDFGIATAIRLGLPLLIGAGVSACPLICAAKHLWLEENFDPRVYKLFEALQSLEDAVFRLDQNGSAAAYKHSTAVCLKLLGLIESNEIHPHCTDRRPGDEEQRMLEALARPLRLAERLEIPHFALPTR